MKSDWNFIELAECRQSFMSSVSPVLVKGLSQVCGSQSLQQLGVKDLVSASAEPGIWASNLLISGMAP